VLDQIVTALEAIRPIVPPHLPARAGSFVGARAEVIAECHDDRF
jgi:hypothetical protein